MQGRSVEELEAIVRRRICAVCTERTVDGRCGLEGSDCPLFRLFPAVARAILSTHSDDITAYVEAIRHQVCPLCREQAPDGSCALRDQVRCALDAYLMLVVDAIEEATGKTFDRSVLTPPGGQAFGRLEAQL
ncbi:MAG: hypothetical protein RMK57_08885 [Bryobacterales bacterium]|nr:hypothetical protein [Bryobacteraceae bacterium]MDW8354630.1 hypothetical protein [Bryobacterales bacterium]